MHEHIERRTRVLSTYCKVGRWRNLNVPTRLETYSFESRVLLLSKTKAIDKDKRVEKIVHLISRDHLNKKELAHVDDIISTRYDLFHLRRDKLEKINVTPQQTTLWSIRSNIGMQAISPIHKVEIYKQIKELRENKIQPSLFIQLVLVDSAHKTWRTL